MRSGFNNSNGVKNNALKSNPKERVFIKGIGCPRRLLDVSRLINYFYVNNISITKDPSEASKLLIVTCGFKKNKEIESLNLISELKKHPGELIVLGCLPEIAPSILKEEFQGKNLATKDLEQIDNFFPDFEVKYKDIPDAHYYSCHGFNADAFLRISYGCLGNCAYCGIKKAIGSLKSKSITTCLNEYYFLLNQGYRKFVILSDDVGAYGLDIGTSFRELLLEMSRMDHIAPVSWYIQELHPIWAIKYKEVLSKLIKEGKIGEILCAVQSGSNRILKLMNRHDNTEEIINTLLHFKALNPNLKIETQVIIGFPSETEEEFADTLALVKRINFDRVVLYPYYDAENTLASKMKNKISNEVINVRLKKAIHFLQAENMNYACEEISGSVDVDNKVDISNIIFQDGWFEDEGSHRWSQKESVIKIPTGRKLERISFTVKGVPVGLNRGVQQLSIIQDKEEKTVTITEEVGVTINIISEVIKFRSNLSFVPMTEGINNDRRELSFNISNLDLMWDLE